MIIEIIYRTTKAQRARWSGDEDRYSSHFVTDNIPLRAVCVRANCHGKKCWWTFNPEVLKPVPAYVWAMAPSDYGRPFPRFIRTVVGNDAGCTRQPMFSTKYQLVFSQRPKRNFTRSGMRTTRMKPTVTLTTSPKFFHTQLLTTTR